MRKLATVFAIALAVPLALACGGGDDGDGGGDTPDAAVQQPDANNGGSGALGEACVGDGMGGQGDCATGFICLELQGQNSFCSQMCTPAQQDPCAQQTGYAGPGLPACALNLQDANGNTLFTACLVICMDTTGMICDTTTCNGQCPGSQTCSAAFQDGTTTGCI